MKKHSYLTPLAALSLIGLANSADAAREDRANCAPEPGVCYTTDECDCYYCLGPTQIGVNPAVGPRTCNGDIMITVAGFYWGSNQDGMEYAIENAITLPTPQPDPSVDTILELNNVIDAKYKTPDFKWDWGFKVGIGYISACDGWDIGVLYTWYRGRASSHDEAEPDDNRTLITLWSEFAPAQGLITYATDIQTHWRLNLDLIDIELGREYWTSKYLSFRPFVGLRIAYIKQKYEIQHKGGSWDARQSNPVQAAFNNKVDINNKFHGVGVIGGFDTVWNLGCGWAFFGDLAASILYGKFSIDHNEYNRLASDTHDKTKILETDDSFTASSAILDTTFGIQWATMFCACQYGLTLKLGWEHHVFFNQNQMWRVNRIRDLSNPSGLPNNTGENVFFQRRGDLTTQGWTLTVRFDF